MLDEEALRLMERYHIDSLYTFRQLFRQCRTQTDVNLTENILVGAVRQLALERMGDSLVARHVNVGGPPLPVKENHGG